MFTETSIPSAPWQATILTLFPDMFPGALGFSVVGSRLAEEKWQCQTVNIETLAMTSMALSTIPQVGVAPAW